MQNRSKFQIRSDAAKQRWVRDDKKEAFWRKHVSAWKQSGLSKRAYCIAQNLPQSSFNAWRRELDLRDRERKPATSGAEQLVNRAQNPGNSFVQIRLVPDSPLAQEGIESELDSPPVAEKHGAVEVLMPGGALLRIDENCSAGLVSKLFAALKGM